MNALPAPQLKTGDTLVVATHNPNKRVEINHYVRSCNLHILGADAFNLPEPEETGDSFEANAILKAESGAHYADDHMVLADDSGIEIDALGGAPGIYSARWGGEAKDFAFAMQRVERELREKGLEPTGQSARFVCVLALAQRGHVSHTFRGTVEGTLTFPARGDAGFGYDPIFIANGYTDTFAQINKATKRDISHRADAFSKLVRYIQID